MKYKRIQPYRSVCIAELEMQRPLRVTDGGLAVYTGYQIVDEFGEALHQSYFYSPVVACGAADILIDEPKKFDKRIADVLRAEKNLLEF